MFKCCSKENKASFPAFVLKDVELPQIVADKLPVKLPEIPLIKKSDHEDKPDLITRVLEYEHTPIIAAATVGFLAGVIVGFMISPVKSGVRIGCNNKAVNNDFDDDYDEEYDFDDYAEDE